jgi:hypothetical protein
MVACDNCLLLFPLRPGAMLLSFFMMLYSIIGGIILFLYGAFWYFTSYEPDIYAGISMIIGIVALLTFLAIWNESYMWVRLMFYVWPFIIVLTIIRAGMMIARLNAYQSNIIWECANGDVIYNATAIADGTFASGKTIPATLCPSSFSTLSLAITLAVVIDAVLQIYLYFLDWRFKALLEQYFAAKFVQNGLYSF